MRVCIGVVLYYPNSEDIERLKNYYAIFEDIYVFDNTPDKIMKLAFPINKVHYYNNQRNEGVAFALNFICNQAINDGYDFMITLDQASIISNQDILEIKDFISNNNMDEIGIVAPTIIYDHKKKKKIKKNNKVSFIKWTITSGSAINLNLFKHTKGFDENYFIDRVDYDYCYLLKVNNKKIVRLSWVHLYQKLGDTVGNHSEHNEIRNYYIFRNRIYYYNKYKKGLLKHVLIFCGSFKQITKILIFEKDKRKKLRMCLKAFFDYKEGKMGKFNNYTYI